MILHKIQGMWDNELLERFEHIVSAKAIKDYLGEKEDTMLTLEIRLCREEIIKRASRIDNKVNK